MSGMRSTKLVTPDNGKWFVVEGGVADGYDLFEVEPKLLGHFQRSWQAVHAAHEVQPEERS